MDTAQSDLNLLLNGEIIASQLTPAGSNYTFLVKLCLDSRTGMAIYKPREGEAPLWDFPWGTLYKREYAAYLFSQALGWDFIPLTVIRQGPHGVGSVQQFVEHDPRQNYYTLTALTPTQAPALQMVACFDLVANNTDRKAGHLLLDAQGKLWGIDHGLTFHADTKIRTVIWDFKGQAIPGPLLAALAALKAQVPSPQGHLRELLELLPAEEVQALLRRLEWVLTERVYPGAPGQRPFPA
ncbi:MAG: SCO1664 family protein [Dehalococcoidia bacterium]|nr:SCO1664 family protein [Dehalococcoidia bacterium]MSQ16934.1 SCO1664 family protein [Dehalococcoidia bacterium]